MNKMKKNIYTFLQRNNVYLDEDIYSYGFDITKKYLLFLIIVIPINIMNNRILEFSIFLFTFISLRQYLGGLHFKNDNICFLFSIIITIFIPLYANNIPKISIVKRTFMVIVTFLLVYFIGVVDNENKKLDDIEKKYLQKRAFILLLIFSILILLLYDFDYVIFNVILLTILLMDTNILIAYLKSFL